MKDQKWRCIINEFQDNGKRFHNVLIAGVEDITRWFPEINPRFFTNFNVDKMEFAFENKGNLSIWTFHRVENS